MENASPSERENAERMSPNDEGPMSEAVEDGQEQIENASPAEEANADRADPAIDGIGVVVREHPQAWVTYDLDLRS